MATVRISPDKTDHAVLPDYGREAARHDATSQPAGADGPGPGRAGPRRAGPGRAGRNSLPRWVNA